MAPIKFEENIKNKLDRRTIEPSSHAWNKLSKQLDKNKKNSYTVIWKLAIAASIITALFVFINHKPTIVKKEQNNIVEIKKEQKTKPLQKTHKKEKEAQNNYQIKPIVKTKESIKQHQVVTYESKDETTINKQIESKPYVNLTLKHTIKNRVELEVKNKAQKPIVKPIQESEDSNQIAINKEVEILLQQAMKETKNINVKDKIVIDYKDLLMEAEDYPEESLRNKLIEKIKNSYHSVKTYVVNND